MIQILSEFERRTEYRILKDFVSFTSVSINELKNGRYIKYFYNGSIRERGSYRDGEKNGPFESYFLKGKQLFEKGSYKDDELDGLHLTYWDNGNLCMKILYEEGKIVDGIIEHFDKMGQFDYKRIVN